MGPTRPEPASYVPDTKYPVPILRTRLHRPQVARDVVLRDALLERLEDGRRLPLTLVSAPAGYGKSTLVSRWLERSAAPGAWLAVDEEDADLRSFLCYLIAAVRTVYADACGETLGLLRAPDLPSPRVLAAQLINDLDDLGEELLLVLDDYHRLRESAVHDVLNDVLAHPPRGLHLVIVGRRDPPLKHRSLRAGRLMNEFRVQDLQLTESETSAFFERALGRRIEPEAVARVHRVTEGWPVGLRLTALVLRHHPDAGQVTEGIAGDPVQLQEYLLEEILTHQPPGMRACLEATSILDRFCAPLCEAVCQAIRGVEELLPSGKEFVQELQTSGLLTVALDERGQWYRFHHLFQDLLRHELKERASADDVAALHRAAARWLETEGLLEEALHHLLEIGEPGEAGGLIVRRRHPYVEGEQWSRIHHWLSLLSAQIVDADPDLLILQARSCDKRGHLNEMGESLDRAEALLESRESLDPDDSRRLGEVLAFRCLLRYHQARGEDALTDAEQALALLPEEAGSERANVMMTLCAAQQMVGRVQQGLEMLYDALQRDATKAPTYHGRLLQTLAFMQWMDADLQGLVRTARTMGEVGREHSLPETTTMAHYFQGAALYHLNELESAAAALRPVADDPHGPSFFMHLMSVEASALIHEAGGRSEVARRLVDALSEHLLRAGNTTYLPHVQALQAALDLRQDRVASAVRWAHAFETGQTTAGYHFSVPETTVARIWLQEGTPDALAKAEALLARLYAFFESTHNIRFRTEVLALQALVHEAKGDRKDADARLEEAIRLALPGGWLRLFADLGPPLVPVLNRVSVDPEGLKYVGRILTAFQAIESTDTPTRGARAASTGRRMLLDPLTERELEVLGLLAERLTNKEIAARLYIAPATVRRHTENIYSKLGVHGRREAVAKAQGLGMLPV